MGKKRQKRQQKTTRKHHHHTHDATLPYIEVSPNVEKKPVPYLPKVVIDCQKRISRRNIRKIQRRLQFADPHDLRYLSRIRIVEPTSLILPSKRPTTGCYQPKWKHREPEIWLSSDLFEFPGVRTCFINWFVLRRDHLFETLFHELGHHKAYHIRLVSHHKQEAYADKYLTAYKQAWSQHRRRTRVLRFIFDSILSVFSNRYTMFVYCFWVRNKNAQTQQIYRIQKQLVLGKISTEECSEQMDQLIETVFKRRKSGTSSKGWQHPLRNQAYRDKFRLDEHGEDKAG